LTSSRLGCKEGKRDQAISAEKVEVPQSDAVQAPKKASVEEASFSKQIRVPRNKSETIGVMGL
jgi:hypothetical protein